MADAAVRFKRRNLPYTQIANAALRDKRMSLAVRGFFALMLSLPVSTDHSVAYFAKVGGISRDTVYKYFGILEELGYLTREQQHDNGGRFAANVYELNDVPCRKKPDTVLPDTVEPCTVKTDAKEITQVKNNTPIAPTGGEREGKEKICEWTPDRFLAFWAYYRDTFCVSDHSRAGERNAAAIAWDKLSPDDKMLQKLAAKLAAIMRTRQWKDGIGIKMASTFLNGIRLGKISLDELPEPSPQSRSGAPPDEPQREENQWLN